MKTEQLRMPAYGGQALIEGVLMRGKYALAAAFRKPDGKIEIHTEKLEGIYKNNFFKIPFLRGVVILWDSLVLGMKYLTISANIQAETEEEKVNGFGLYLAVITALAFALVLFFISPLLISKLIGFFIPLNIVMSNLLEGVARLFIMIAYLMVISRMTEIRRVFSYHGAEHKTINAYEDRAELSVKSVMKYSVQHPRCGTSFLLTLVILSILVFTLIGELTFGMKILSRIFLVPILAMVSYEIIRLMGNLQGNPLVGWLSKPNMALQGLTTREPTPEMVEVAITAFNSLLEMERLNL